ncbi:hypothetical protein GCM10026986_03650 [Nitrincola alkalisediminis]
MLSGIELHAFLIFDQYQQTVNIREQFPIDVEDTPVVVLPLAKQRAIIAMVNTLAEEQRLIQK